MKCFLERHGASSVDTISTFDRVIFKGHLNGFFPAGAFGRYLWQRGVLLKDAGKFFEQETKRLRTHLEEMAALLGRPYEYLADASTHRSGSSKETLARQIAERDGVTEGLLCVLSVLEPCSSFAMVPNRATHRLEVSGVGYQRSDHTLFRPSPEKLRSRRHARLRRKVRRGSRRGPDTDFRVELEIRIRGRRHQWVPKPGPLVR